MNNKLRKVESPAKGPDSVLKEDITQAVTSVIEKHNSELKFLEECRDGLKPVFIKEARAIMSKVFKDDPGFRIAYVANIAMLIYDSQHLNPADEASWDHEVVPDLGSLEGCNEMANKILDLIFEDKR